MSTKDLLETLLEQARITPDLTEYLDREEVGDAELFKIIFADRVVFDHAEKQWYLWDGRHWLPDQTRKLYTLVGNELAAEYLGAAEIERRGGNATLSNRLIKRARLLLHLNRIRNILELASHLEGIALKGTEWDIPPMLLPVSNGIVDLTDGTFRKGVPADYVRSCAPTEWQGLDCPAPQWERTILDIFGGDSEMIDFMQRLLGYSITGDTREQVLPILWGQGSNGKSTLMDAISGVLGEGFCSTTQADSLMDIREGDGNGPRPFIYALRHKRLVWASESKEGRRLNTGLVKQLTGDRSMSARTLYGKPATFPQTHKIFLLTNHCPRLPDGDDMALWRRILLIPSNERFVDEPHAPSEHPRDRQLLTKLLRESSGILAWLVRGCLAWQQLGLGPPRSVSESTEAYRKNEDLIGQFIADRLLVGDGMQVSAKSVYKQYAEWCEESGNRPVAARSLGQTLTRRFGPAKSKWFRGRTQRVYEGIDLRPENDPLLITEPTEYSGNSS